MRFRSEEMAFCQLYLQSEAGYACLSELGELNLVQFKDVNPKANAFERKFVNEVLQCDEMERKLCYVKKEILKNGIPILDTGENPETPRLRDIANLAAKIEKFENELRQVSHITKTLKYTYLELIEFKHILQKTQLFFEMMMVDLNQNDEEVTLLGAEGLQVFKLKFVTGVILRDRIPSFERLLWRASCGNVFVKLIEIETPMEDPLTGNQVHKAVFIIFFQGDKLKSRVLKICEGFHGALYPCPETPFQRQDMIDKVMMKIEDLNIILFQTNDHHHHVLISAARNIENWIIKVVKMKAIYHALNLFNLDVMRKCLIAECWIPVIGMKTVRLALRRGMKRYGSNVPPILNRTFTSETPPTFNRTNRFTRAFQDLVDAYGIASYREINPMPFTIISFPFLFAVMFGDFGHGCLICLFATFLVFFEKSLATSKSNNEIWQILFAGRYVILLMGLFSMYTGFVYNDLFSKSLNVFSSSWRTNYNESTVMSTKSLQLNPSLACEYDQVPYLIGVDPVWQLALNKINFLNALKMKTAIIIGVSHMLIGLGLRLFNYRHFNDTISVYCDFIPQVVFLTSLIFYLVVLIFIKWALYGPLNDFHKSPACAPSILVTFIDMILSKDTSPLDHCNTVLMFPGQDTLQKVLVTVASLCVPIMLFAKPICIFIRQKHQSTDGCTSTANCDARRTNGAAQRSPSVDFVVGERGDKTECSQLFFDQGIRSIEYVLGSVSHTASYLRLWALSLAHAQLSEVLWSMVMAKGLVLHSSLGGVWMWIIFSIWAILTVGVLVLMEGLSAFLHTLRLHWIEFQSKFYSGRGYAFAPFSFEVTLNQ